MRPPTAPPFDQHVWASRWKRADAAEFAELAAELVEQLRRVPLQSNDFFDRPVLAAVLQAVQIASR